MERDNNKINLGLGFFDVFKDCLRFFGMSDEVAQKSQSLVFNLKVKRTEGSAKILVTVERVKIVFLEGINSILEAFLAVV